jgi:hypothetical protein
VLVRLNMTLGRWSNRSFLFSKDVCKQQHCVWHGHCGHSVTPPTTHSAAQTVPTGTLYVARTLWTLSHFTNNPQCRSNCANSHTVSGMDTVDTQSFHQQPTVPLKLCQQAHCMRHGHCGHSVIPLTTHIAAQTVPTGTLYVARTLWTLSHSTSNP